MYKTRIALIFTFCFSIAFSQTNPVAPTNAALRLQGKHQQAKLLEKSLVAKVPFRSAGPTVFSGRVTDVAVNPDDPSMFYVAYASGGLWYTENNGTSFHPLFDDEASMTIGDIAVDWERNIIWVGTGENNSSRSSYAGTGMYKSTDNGKNWQYRGLPESHHIGRILLHPSDPEILWVAVLGHLYSPNEERGIYKSIDGGESWQQVLFVNDKTGAIDLVIDPDDPDILYGATWERSRYAWDFIESGAGSGIYKSVDGGITWELLSTARSGFPTGEGVGRIGLEITKSAGKTILYSILDNYNRRPKEEKEEEDVLTKDDLRGMSKAEFLALEPSKIESFLRDNNFPEKYSAGKVRTMVEKDEIIPLALVEYLEDANSLLFDTPVIGAEVYRSDDEGISWIKQNKEYLDAVYNSYGYYFGQIRVAPQDPDRIYILGVPVLKSGDAGKTWKSIDGDNVHADHHALWINASRDGHLILGNDGGINISYDDGKKWIKCNSPALGQFYAVAVDMAKPYNIYGGLQDNGVWGGPSDYQYSDGWQGTGQYPYKPVLGGDGMQVAVDTRDNNIIYTGFQFGFYFRINKETGQRSMIRPKHDLGERPLRFNWQTPIHLSLHNQDILYLGSNKLHRSLNKGEDFLAISEDLTKGGKKGDVPFGTLTTIHESPLKFGLLYVGTDDGLVHITRDGGFNWEKISDDLPQNLWVSRVWASSHVESVVYAALNGYRYDDFKAYLYVSDDYGKNWRQIGIDLPPEPVNVVKEDPVNADLLYAGTDHGLYISLDRGQHFMQMKEGLPAVPVHDLVVHPRENELVVGTHGRSIYVAPVGPVQQLTKESLSKEILAFAIEPVRFRSNWGNSRANWQEPNLPELKLPVYVKSSGPLSMAVYGEKDLLLNEIEVNVEKGINYLTYDLSIMEKVKNDLEALLKNDQKEKKAPESLKKADNGKFYLPKGKYKIVVKKNGGQSEQALELK